MKRSVLPCMTAILLICMMSGTGLYADTLRLFEGSVLVGKIIADEGKTLLFANSYGTFRIKKTKIDNTYVTGSYLEDIEVHRKIKATVDEGEIAKNYRAGQNRKEGKPVEPIMEEPVKPEPDEQKPAPGPDKAEPPISPKNKEETGGDKWTSGRFSLSGSFIYNLGSGTSSLPYGFGGNFALDQGLDFIPGARHPAMFGLRFEAGYVHLRKGSLSITGFTTGAGPMWAFPSMKNSWGCIVLALMPGISFLKAHRGGQSGALMNPIIQHGQYVEILLVDGSGTRSAPFSFMGQAILGYQKSWGIFSLFVNARYTYVLHRGDDIMSIAGEVGFGLNAW